MGVNYAASLVDYAAERDPNHEISETGILAMSLKSHVEIQ